jgi:hypothetical protein
MDFRGRWHGKPYHDITARKWLITFEVEEVPSVYDKTAEKDLTLTVKEYRKGRSLNANAYFHCLVGKVAEVLGVSHIEIHNRLIAEYGQVDLDMKTIILKDSIPWEKVESIHLRPSTATKVLDDGELYRAYYVMRGSHTYDTKEMARLIDGVVQEAKELGIETLTPNEIERMKQQWTV